MSSYRKKSAGIETVDAAFETVADLIPGGKIMLAPFKSLFHTGVDDPDPMEDIGNKLNQIDGKLDKLDSKLSELEKNINKNTHQRAHVNKNGKRKKATCDLVGHHAYSGVYYPKIQISAALVDNHKQTAEKSTVSRRLCSGNQFFPAVRSQWERRIRRKSTPSGTYYI